MNNSKQFGASINTSFSTSSRGIVLVVVESCIFLVLNLTALVGNTLVCVALYRNTSLRTVTNNFVLSLALTDLLMAVLVMPLFAAASLADQWIGGSFGFKIYGYCGFTLASTSMLTVMLLAVNRYFRVARPTFYCNIYSKKSSAVMSVTAWIVSVVIVGICLPVFGVEFEPYPTNPTVVFLVFSSASEFTSFAAGHTLFNAFSGLVIIACYVKIYQTIRHHNNASAPSSQEGHSSYGVEEAKITRILTVVLIGFYLCWLPPLFTAILDTLKSIGENSRKYQNFYYNFPAFGSSAINPLIYAAMSRPFRKEFFKIVRFGM